MIRKTLITMGVLMIGGCSPAVAQEPIIQDHYRNIIDQKPYHVEVCKDVSVGGDKSGDMLKGAIIGGIMVGVFENLGAAYISASHKDIYAFLLLILVLMFKPSGLLGVDAKVKA